MYTYNTTNLADVSKADFESSAHTKDHWKKAETIFAGAGLYCKVVVDAKGGIHIAGYDRDAGDIRYAKLNKYDVKYSESTMSCIVDSNGIIGSNLTLDVAFDKAGTDGKPANDAKAIPYLGYYGSSGPKMAYLAANGANQASLPAGADSDIFTGYWEVTEIPTTSNAPKDRINVAVWKKSGVLAWSTTDFNKNGTKGTDVVNTGNNTFATTSKTYGNGTNNPVVGYEIRPTSSIGFMETAQMQ